MILKEIPQWYIEISAVILGLAFGSFLNVVIFRLPRGISIIKPRSACPKCKSMIRWYDNIPLVSFLILGGKCRRCDERISLRYPLVELLSGILAWGCVRLFPPAYAGILYAFCAALLVISFIDLDFKIIPDSISLPGIIVGLACGFWFPPAFVHRLIGAGIGAGLFLLVAGGYWLITRREGMGMGDVKLLAMIGAFLGWPSLPVVLVSSSIIGSLIGIVWIIIGKKTRKFQIPYGPFLSLGAIIYLFFGQQILTLLKL